MLLNKQISTISELRFKTTQVLRKVKDAPVYLFHHATPQGVLLSLEKYEEMQSILEDYFLSLKAREYEQENKKAVEWVSEKDVKKVLNR